MSKYIRTKDGIELNNNLVVPVSPKLVKKLRKTGYLKDVIKQADTIEKLCDEFVVLNPCENNYPMLMTGLFVDINHNLLHISYVGENKLDYEEHCFPSELPLDKADVYGAIWTKGEHDEPILKSVAIMDEKGELELL